MISKKTSQIWRILFIGLLLWVGLIPVEQAKAEPTSSVVPQAEAQVVEDSAGQVEVRSRDVSPATPRPSEQLAYNPAALSEDISESVRVEGQIAMSSPQTWFLNPAAEADEAPSWLEALPSDLDLALVTSTLEPDQPSLTLNRSPGVPRLAIAATGLNPSQAVYDPNSLPQIAITPAELASSDEAAVAVSSDQVEILTPQTGSVLDIPSTSVVLRFPVGAQIVLLVNGQLVDAGQVGRTETDPTTQIRTQTWYGISLAAGDNRIEVVSTETGQVLASTSIIVRGQPEKLALFAPETLPADGRSTATVRGQLIDRTGVSSVWNTTVTLNASDGTFIGADQAPDQPGFQTAVVNGEFIAELQSSLTAHLVQLQATASGFEAFGQIQFVPPQRPSLVSGVIDLRLGARGTDFYDSYRDFLPLDSDNRYQLDIDSAVFATGNIGEWLYTGAYNSDRALNENCRGESTLFRAGDGDCQNVYPTYGDNSQSTVVAPSLDSLYLRFERSSPTNPTGVDYAMWGDFNTEEFATAAQLFTATSRQLHGFKASYNFGDLAVTGLYANNVEGFQRDTIAPDGTSGFYFTSQRNLVPGSERVYLELEELERPGTVLERQLLARGADYEIDYDRGTLLFSDPVARTAVNDFGQLLVRRIVTTYQHEDGGNTNILAGRLQYSLNRTQGQESWVGASYLTEAQGNRDFTLYGADARIALGDRAQITAEIAQSSSDFDRAGNIDANGNVSGTAYRLELDGGLGDWLDGRAYFRSTDAGFTNIATTSFVPGQTRYGTNLTARLGSTTSLRAQFDHEDNFGTAPQVITDLADLLNGQTAAPGTALDNSLTTYSLGLSQQLGDSTAEVDWIHRDRSDRLNALPNVTSDQIRTRLTTPLSDKLTLIAQNELNLSSEVDPIYPSRTLIGVNWEAMPWLNVGVNQIFYGGGGNSRGSATLIDVSGEHTFASDTTVHGQFSTVDGRQIGGTIGLEQGITLAPGLKLDLGYERIFSTLGNDTAASTQFRQPYATANTASSLGLAGGESYSIGLSYTDNPDFQASTRFEHRSSARNSNTVFSLSALGRLTPELTVLGDYQMARAANQGISGLGTTSLLKLGLAYRDPDNDRFNALLRYEYRLNPNTIPSNAIFGSSTDTQEHLLAAEAIYAPNWRWELYGKYALRNSSTAINSAGGNFSTSSLVQLAQLRATYRLGYRWDAVGEARWLGGGGYSETGFSVEAGYYPLPDLRLSAGYSAGSAHDRDFGEDRSAGGFYLGVTAKLSGLLNGFGTQPSAPAQQRESIIGAAQEPTENPASVEPQEPNEVSATVDEVPEIVVP